MAFSLRLPPILDRQARAKADQLGLPLNGLICVALDAFLNGGASPVRSSPPPVDQVKPVLGSHGGMPLRPADPSPAAAPPAPPVPLSGPPGPGATKAERRAYTEHVRASRKAQGRT